MTIVVIVDEFERQPRARNCDWPSERQKQKDRRNWINFRFIYSDSVLSATLCKAKTSEFVVMFVLCPNASERMDVNETEWVTDRRIQIQSKTTEIVITFSSISSYPLVAATIAMINCHAEPLAPRLSLPMGQFLIGAPCKLLSSAWWMGTGHNMHRICQVSWLYYAYAQHASDRDHVTQQCSWHNKQKFIESTRV